MEMDWFVRGRCKHLVLDLIFNPCSSVYLSG